MGNKRKRAAHTWEHGRWNHKPEAVREMKRQPPEYIEGPLEWEKALTSLRPCSPAQRSVKP